MTIADNKMKARKSGAIEVIMNVMKIHMGVGGICEQGCGVLWNITANGKIILIKTTIKVFIQNNRL